MVLGLGRATLSRSNCKIIGEKRRALRNVTMQAEEFDSLECTAHLSLGSTRERRQVWRQRHAGFISPVK